MENKDNILIEDLPQYKNNKYIILLKEYKKFMKEEADLVYCAKLRGKAKILREKKSLELYNYLINSKRVKLNKIEKYLKTGADVNFKFKHEMTLYMIAALKANIEVLDYLYNNGANVEAVNMFGQNAFMLAHFIKNNEDLANILSGNFKNYLPVVRLMHSHGLDIKKSCDYNGVDRDNYILGETEPFTNTYKQFIKAIFNIKENSSIISKLIEIEKEM